MDNKKYLRPLHDNVLLIQYVPETTHDEGGLYIPDTTKDTQVRTTCIVSALGDDVKSKHLAEGKFVIIPRRTGKWVDWNDAKYVLVNEKDILCVIEGLYGYNDVEELEKFGINLMEDDYSDRTV